MFLKLIFFFNLPQILVVKLSVLQGKVSISWKNIHLWPAEMIVSHWRSGQPQPGFCCLSISGHWSQNWGTCQNGYWQMSPADHFIDSHNNHVIQGGGLWEKGHYIKSLNIYHSLGLKTWFHTSGIHTIFLFIKVWSKSWGIYMILGHLHFNQEHI